MRSFVRTLAHLAVLVPLVWGEWLLSVTIVLFLAMCYVKAKKLETTLLIMADKGGAATKDYAQTARLRERWAWLTFLSPLEAPQSTEIP